MQFNESESIYISMPIIPDIFIYFLLDENNEVVYVGQTTNGLQRPYSHIINKEFNRVIIIPCDINELDEFENKYILKYRPKYNKILNFECMISLKHALKIYNKDFHCKVQCKKFIKMLQKDGIQIYTFNDRQMLLQEEFWKFYYTYYDEMIYE